MCSSLPEWCQENGSQSQSNCGNAAWLKAISQNNQEKVQELLDNGQDIDGTSGDGVTGLMTACLAGPRAIVRFLIRCGASVNTVDNQGQFPLSYAVKAGHVAIAKYLVKYGANAQVRNYIVFESVRYWYDPECPAKHCSQLNSPSMYRTTVS